MNRKIKITAAFLVLCLCICSCSGNSLSRNGVVVTNALTDNPNLVGNIPCTFPLVTDDTSLNILFTGRNTQQTEDIFVWKKYEEMTGVHINWTTVTKEERSEAVYTALVNKSALDLIIRCKISSTKLTQYGESGLILDLTQDGLLEKNAPNCWAYLQSHPDALASVTSPDGAIYSLPQVNSGAELRVSRKILVNKQWLDRVGMDLPTTTEELYNLLVAFKEQDANGNGDPTDEIPLCPADWSSLSDMTYGAFGLGNRGNHNTSIDCDETTGNVRFIATCDGYKDWLIYLNRLYSEKLLDNNIFTITSDEWNNNILNDRVGMFASTNLASLPADTTDNWVCIEEALEGPNGDKLWEPIRANFHSTGAALIPATCSNPELTLQWLDYFWTDEGTLFYHMGVEGETFEVTENGTYDYMPSIYDEMKETGATFDDVVYKYTPYPGGSNPTVEIAPYFMGGEMNPMISKAAQSLFAYGPKEFWPSFTFTATESENLDILQYDINKYVDSSRIEFVSGEKSIDEWDSYTKQVESLGEADLLKIYQSALDRYNALLKQSVQTTSDDAS